MTRVYYARSIKTFHRICSFNNSFEFRFYFLYQVFAHWKLFVESNDSQFFASWTRRLSSVSEFVVEFRAFFVLFFETFVVVFEFFAQFFSFANFFFSTFVSFDRIVEWKKYAKSQFARQIVYLIFIAKFEFRCLWSSKWFVVYASRHAWKLSNHEISWTLWTIERELRS